MPSNVQKRSEAARAEANHLRLVARQQRRESIGVVWRARRLCFDHYGPILAMRAVEESDRPGVGSVEDIAIRQLFSISVELASAIEMNGDPKLDSRLRALIDRTDGMIDALRRAAVASHMADTAAPSDRPIAPGLVAKHLQEAALGIDRLLDVAKSDSQPGPIDLEEASRAVLRAQIALTPPAEPSGQSVRTDSARVQMQKSDGSQLTR